MACANNGRLAAAQLAPIPGGQLRRGKVADSWNAMCAEYRRQTGRTPLPNGSQSTYRTYAGQVAMRQMWCNQGRCGNAAVPGTSNHGCAEAVDGNSDAQRAADTLPKYGWDRSHSDAPWEAWHRVCDGRWDGPAPVPVDPLTKRERRLVDELLGIRRRVNRRGGKWGKVERERATAIKKALTTQLSGIRKAAGKDGWTRERRRTRYRLIKNAVGGA